MIRLDRPPGGVECLIMGDREVFLDWFNTTWRAAEDPLHDGDAGPRFTIWSEREPVTLFGLWFNATDPPATRAVFQRLAEIFEDNVSSAIDLVAADVSGDLAYTVHREITSTSIDGVPSDYVLRVTQVYRREDGEWKVVHRHGDRDPRRPDPHPQPSPSPRARRADTGRASVVSVIARKCRYVRVDELLRNGCPSTRRSYLQQLARA